MFKNFYQVINKFSSFFETTSGEEEYLMEKPLDTEFCPLVEEDRHNYGQIALKTLDEYYILV
jgi:hypothetical protein